MSSSPDDVDSAWRTIVSEIVYNDDEALYNLVMDSIKHKATCLKNIMKQSCTPQEKIAMLKDLEENENRLLRRIRSSKEMESSECISPSQLKALRKMQPSVSDISWFESHFRDYLVQDGVLSEDGEKSITDKTSENERAVAIWNFLLGLSLNDIHSSVIPGLRKTEHESIANEMEKALRTEDSDETLSPTDIIHLINPRRVGNEMYKDGTIMEAEHVDLTSADLPRGQKVDILKKIPWKKFVESLKYKYPHFHKVCLQVRGDPDLEVESFINNEDEASTDMDDSSTAMSSGNGDAGKTVMYERAQLSETSLSNSSLEWCTCHKCKEMPLAEERVCCGVKRGRDCRSTGKVKMMSALIAGGHSLKSELKIKPYDSAGKGIIRKCLYRQFSVYLYGHLGPKQRKPLPSCCVWKIRDMFSDPNGEYEGFKPSFTERQISGSH